MTFDFRRTMAQRRGRTVGVRPRLVECESREVPAMLLGLTGANALVAFDSATPGTIVSTTPIIGLGVGESLVGIDYRPATGQLYGVGNTNVVYLIDATTGIATATGPAFTPVLSGTAFGVDFNPIPDRLRVVSNTGQNLRLNPTNGALAGNDTPLAYDATSYADFFSGTAPSPQIVSAAYSKITVDPTTSGNVVTLFELDSNLDALVTQGGPDGTPSPNAGQLFVVSPLGFDVTAQSGFDIDNTTNTAYATSGTSLYTIDLATGASTKLGTTTSALNGLTVVPPAAGAGTISLSASTYSFGTDRNPIAVTVQRTGGASGSVTVNFATADGTAIAGTDYAPSSGTLTFDNGITSQTVFLSLPGGAAQPAPAKSFTITISTPGGGATLGANAQAIVTIPAVTSAPIPARLTAVGAGPGGGPAVTVINPADGSVVATFFAYESTFTGGVTVATGDVNGDGIDDIIVGSGAGGGPRVRVFDGSKLATPATAGIADFFVYEASFRGGVNVASGDVDGDGFADLIIGSGVGGGPRVRVIDGSTVSDATPVALKDFFAYEESFRGGVNVGAGEFSGDGKADILAGAGDGGGPRVRIINGDTLATIADYFAYDQSFRNGVLVSAGDINTDGKADVITGSGPGGGPNVKVFNGITSTSISSFFAYDSALRGGVRVSAADYNGDGSIDIVTGSGPGGPSTVKFFALDGTLKFQRDAFGSFTGGVFVG